MKLRNIILPASNAADDTQKKKCKSERKRRLNLTYGRAKLLQFASGDEKWNANCKIKNTAKTKYFIIQNTAKYKILQNTKYCKI